MLEGESVVVYKNWERHLSISWNELAGDENIDRETLRRAAEHLLSFAGYRFTIDEAPPDQFLEDLS